MPRDTGGNTPRPPRDEDPLFRAYIITDIHLGPDITSNGQLEKQGSAAEPLLRELFNIVANDTNRIDALISNGDEYTAQKIVSQKDFDQAGHDAQAKWSTSPKEAHDIDRERFSKVNALLTPFQKHAGVILRSVGNHESRNKVSQAQRASRVFDTDNLRVVVFNPNADTAATKQAIKLMGKINDKRAILDSPDDYKAKKLDKARRSLAVLERRLSRLKKKISVPDRVCSTDKKDYLWLTPHDVSFLAEAIESAGSKPVIVISHIPMNEYANGDIATNILDRDDRDVLCAVHGHREVDEITPNGDGLKPAIHVKHFTRPAPYEGQSYGAHTILEVYGDRVEFHTRHIGRNDLDGVYTIERSRAMQPQQDAFV